MSESNASEVEGIRAVGVRVREGDPNDWPFLVNEVARSLDEQLQSGDSLRAFARRIDAIAQEHACAAIFGASSTGQQLAGAAVAASANGLRLFSHGAPTANVLVVDSLLASGVQILRAAREVKAAGALRVVGCAIAADREGAAVCRNELGDEVVALVEF
jgi:orotate phosphoribosyltransferase